MGGGATTARPPVYEVVGRSGPQHAPRFVVRVSIKGVGEAEAEGLAKQEAETEAAQALLEQARDDQRFGTVAVVGAPNAGKSTLVNALVGQKVAIVTPKAQTTRTRLMGIAIARRGADPADSTRPASSSPSAGSTGRWSPPPGAARRTPT